MREVRPLSRAGAEEWYNSVPTMITKRSYPPSEGPPSSPPSAPSSTRPPPRSTRTPPSLTTPIPPVPPSVRSPSSVRPPAPTSVRTPMRYIGGPQRILLVDDSQSYLDRMTQILREAGYEVVW